MKTLIISALLLSLVFVPAAIAQESHKPEIYSTDSICLSAQENAVYKLIMEYRKKNNLSKIPLSASLTYVAQMHVWDLNTNKPEHGNCNLHSWSGKGKWSACCYTDDHAKAECMWDKPKELTSYQSYGFEIACWGDGLDPEGVLDCWESSPPHNNVILNKGQWKTEWKAIGIAFYDEYAVVWFGWEEDPLPEPAVCE